MNRTGQTLLHYRIVEKIGAGGMGVVWKAIDTRLDRLVALKFLADDRCCEKGRLEREARAVAALNHPNIVTIHAVEEVDGNRVLVMELVEGKSLDRLIPETGLSLGTFYDMACLLLGAVAAAHDRGILHGDLKPANILVSSDGRMKILDFGLARLLPSFESGVPSESSDAADGSSTISLDVRVQGTVRYMSPELLRSERLDARSDIFAVGVVLHEMLLGRPPFTADKPVDLISAIIRDEPPLASESCSDIPEPLARLVRRCLAKEPDRRVQTSREILVRLEELRDQPKSGKFVRSIAVLPFADSRAIGLQLGVTSLLEGSVRKTDNRLRITVQLINASDGYQLWSERYDREMQDIFEVQDEIAHRVVAALKIALTSTERKALAKPKAREPEAYRYYLRGRRFFYRVTQKNLEFGRAMFERAIEIDPDYALAHCGLADCLSFLHLWYEQRPEYLEGAERASKRAVELSPDLAEAHASRGLVFSWCEDCADRAERHFETALLLPQVYRALGRIEDSKQAARLGLEIAERHLQLNPDDVRALYLSSGRWIEAGDRERGLDLARRALELDPDEPTVLFNVACTFAHAELTDEAMDLLERGVARGAGYKQWIEQDSDLDSLRDHPRFRALMQRF